MLGAMVGEKVEFLTKDEETALSRLARAGDLAARDELIRRNIPLVNLACRSYARMMPEHADDIYSHGLLIMIQAASLFDPDRGFRFTTYAVRSIKHQLYRWKIDEMPLIRSPNYMHGKNADPRFKGYVEAARRSKTLGDDFDLIVAEIPDDESSGSTYNADEIDRLEVALTRINPRLADILRRRFGIGRDQERLSKIGSSLGLTKEWVRQLEQQALRAIRQQLSPSSSR